MIYGPDGKPEPLRPEVTLPVKFRPVAMEVPRVHQTADDEAVEAGMIEMGFTRVEHPISARNGKEKPMKKRERRGFRKVARRVAKRAVKDGTITRAERGLFLQKLYDDDIADEMADMVLAQAVECDLVPPGTKTVEWAGLFENVDWKKLAEFIKGIILIFTAL